MEIKTILTGVVGTWAIIMGLIAVAAVALWARELHQKYSRQKWERDHWPTWPPSKTK